MRVASRQVGLFICFRYVLSFRPSTLKLLPEQSKELEGLPMM